MTLWVLEISILILNLQKWGIFRAKFCIFGRKFLDKFFFQQTDLGGIAVLNPPVTD